MKSRKNTGDYSTALGKPVNIKGLWNRQIRDCKTVYPGSIPGVASKIHLISITYRMRGCRIIFQLPRTFFREPVDRL